MTNLTVKENIVLHVEQDDILGAAVSGRELHERLGIGTLYTQWFERYADKCGLREKVDFLLSQNCETENSTFSGIGNPKVDHKIKVSTAKMLAAIQPSEQGRAVVMYLAAAEEAWNTPEAVFARALEMAGRTIERLKNQTFALEQKAETLEIALNDSLRFYTVAKYNKKFKMGWSMEECQQIGKNLTAYCRARSIEIRKCQTNDERFGDVNSYPLTAWDDFKYWY